MKLTDWTMDILGEDGVERIGFEDVLVYEDDETAEVMLPRPVVAKRGDLWVVTATFDLRG